MNNLYQMDKPRARLYINENSSWLKTISNQTEEIPALEKLLAVKNIESNNNQSQQENTHFRNALLQQKEEMQQLNTALDLQQQRLKNDAEKKTLYDIDALCSQDILRDKIKEIEKKFIELKCNFMKYVSTNI